MGIAADASSLMRVEPFGTTRDGRPSRLYILSNETGLEVTLCDFGATIVSIRVPDRRGQPDGVVLGYASLAEYENDRFYMGGVIGRHANRIALGKFTLDEITYRLAQNDFPNHLHGGPQGFHKRLWRAEMQPTAGNRTVTFSYLSPDGEEGYPGNLVVTIRFTVLSGRNDLRLEYEATSDRDTIANLTSHPYFNLAGGGRRDILDHQLLIRARKFTPVDAAMIPTGELRDVANSPFDFTRLTAIGSRIDADDPQLRLAGGYDHNWALDGFTGSTEIPAAQLHDPASGRRLEIFTTEPGIQFYSGNSLNGSGRGKNDAPHTRRCGLCLETQHFPDSPNHANFPSVVLHASSLFRSATTYSFSTP